jgi:F-type H+-transporting ATPase subunit delta
MSRSHAEPSLVASRYASALFAFAEDEVARTKMESELLALAHAIDSDKSLRLWFMHPLHTNAEKSAAIRATLERAKATSVTIKAATHIASAGRIAALSAIAEAFAARCAESRGEVTATVTTARDLTKKQADTITANLSKALGKKIQLVTKRDPSLLGGLKIGLGARELDMSIAGTLERIRRGLINAPRTT